MKQVYGRHILKKLAEITPPAPPDSAVPSPAHEADRAMAGGG
jgi:hypothetical protein